MSEMHLTQPGFADTACGPFIEIKKIKKFKERGNSQYIAQYLALNVVWLMEILKIFLEEQLLIKCVVIKFLILLKIKYMMNIKEVFFQWFINFE